MADRNRIERERAERMRADFSNIVEIIEYWITWKLQCLNHRDRPFI